MTLSSQPFFPVNDINALLQAMGGMYTSALQVIDNGGNHGPRCLAECHVAICSGFISCRTIHSLLGC